MNVAKRAAVEVHAICMTKTGASAPIVPRARDGPSRPSPSCSRKGRVMSDAPADLSLATYSNLGAAVSL